MIVSSAGLIIHVYLACTSSAGTSPYRSRDTSLLLLLLVLFVFIILYLSMYIYIHIRALYNAHHT